MTKIRRVKVDASDEQDLLTGLVVSTEFCRRVLPMLRPEHLKATGTRHLLDWVQDYYESYERAPGEEIQAIFNVEQRNLSEAEAAVISSLLAALSTRSTEEGKQNWAYKADLARNYIRARSLEVLSETVKVLKDRGDLAQAERAVREFNVVRAETSDWEAPWTDVALQMEVLEREDEGFKMDGALGELLGIWRPGWLVVYMGATKRGKCLVGSTPVLLPDGGMKTIEEVVHDQEPQIVTYDETTGKFIPGNISQHHTTGIKSIVRVSTRTGREITTTTNHPYLTVGGWKNISDIQIGERIAVPRRLDFFGEGTMPPEEIRLLAYLLTEGGLTGTQISFTKRDMDVAEDFIRCVNSLGDEVTRWKFSKPRTPEYGITNGKNKKSNVWEWLHRHGIERGCSKDKFIPDAIFTLKREQISEFLSVMFDCDGSVEASRAISYSSASERLIRQMQHLLLRFGIISKLSVSIVKGVLYWELKIRDAVNFNLFMESIGFGIEKTQRAEAIWEQVKGIPTNRGFLDSFPFDYLSTKLESEIQKFVMNGGVRARDIDGYGSFDNAIRGRGSLSRDMVQRIVTSIGSGELMVDVRADIMWDEVTTITAVGKAETYDLTVPDTHCFVAGDVLAHNTWMMEETASQAVTAHGMKALYVNLEMSRVDMRERWMKMASFLPDKKGPIQIPVWDCIKNQDGTCRLTCRTNQEPIPTDYNDVPRYDEVDPYRPCTYCKERHDHLKNYRVSSWFTTKEKREDFRTAVIERVRNFSMQYRGSNLRMVTRPRGSVGMGELRDILDAQVDTGFIPGLLVVDYAGVMKKERGGDSDWLQLDAIFQDLAGFAQERNLILVTGAQVDTVGTNAKILQGTQAAGYKGIFNHVDLGIGLNQIHRVIDGKPSEKDMMIMRANIVAKRHGRWSSDQAYLLQSLELGQPAMDSWAVSAGHKLIGYQEDDNW